MTDKSPYVFPNPALANENFSPPFEMNGMTLRDYFAAQVLPEVFSAYQVKHGSEFIANAAYLVADAMLKAREKSND